MGGGAEAKVVRKRKRKTRSERNHMRLSQMEPDKLDERNLQKKSDDMPSSPYYSLRSSKVVTAPLPPAPREVRMSRNITQGRLTLGLFPYSKSSDCIKRGPIPETASVKKKVEEDLRRIVNPSPECRGDGDAGSSSGNRKLDRIITTISINDKHDPGPFQVLEENKVRRDPSRSSLPSVSDTQMTGAHFQKSSPVSSTSHASDANKQVRACPKSTRSASSYSSRKSNNELDEVLPIEEIADKILLNLKPKFHKLFPTRDLNSELNTSLKKFLNQSSRKVNVPNHTPVIPGNSLKERLQHMPSQQTSATYTTTTSSVFQPFGNEATINPKFHSVSIADTCDESETAIAAQNLLSDSGFITHDKPSSSSLLPPPPPLQYFIASNPSHHNQENSFKSVKFVLAPTNNNIDSYSEPDNEVNAEVESNGTFNHHHRHYPQSFEHYVTYSSIGNFHDHHHHHQGGTVINTSTKGSLGFILPNAFGDTSDGLDTDKPMIINFDRKDGNDSDNEDDSGLALARYNSFMASARSLKAKLERQKECNHIIDQDLPHQCVLPGRGSSCVCHSTSPVTNSYSKNAVNRFKYPQNNIDKHPNTEALSAFGLRRSRSSSGSHVNQGGNHKHSDSYHQNYHSNHHYHLRSRSHLPTVSDSFLSEGNEPGINSGSSNLAQSRHRLKTALDSIFTDPPSKPIKQSVIHSNAESMDWQDVDILTDIFPHTNDDYHCIHQNDVYKQSLDQLRIHQSDMQHQARSFLDQGMNGVGHSQIDHQPPHHSSSPPPQPPSHHHRLHPLSSSSCPTQSWL